MKFVKPSDMK